MKVKDRMVSRCPSPHLDFSPGIFYYANCFFEAFLTVLRVLSHSLLIFEVFEPFLNVESCFKAIS